MTKRSDARNLLAGGLLAGLVAAGVLVSMPADREPTSGSPNRGAGAACALTNTDALGPYYQPGSPVRDATGSGSLTIKGTVLSWPACEPVSGATIEFWQADGAGVYTDDQRATVVAGDDGTFAYRSDFPGQYEARPVHIHVKVSGGTVQDLITQLYPQTEPAVTEIAVELVALARDAQPPAGYSTTAPLTPVR